MAKQTKSNPKVINVLDIFGNIALEEEMAEKLGASWNVVHESKALRAFKMLWHESWMLW